MKILITGGATQEPIDNVRVITNMSTGRTAATIAQAFSHHGFDVTYVHGVNAILPTLPCTTISFDTHASLEQHMTHLLKTEKYEAVIHLAAVSDYSLESIQQGDNVWAPHEVGKLASGENLILTLKPTRKLVHGFKEQAIYADFILVAFKLTSTSSLCDRLEAVRKLSKNPAINYVVHNDLHDVICEQRHKFTVYEGREPVDIGHFPHAEALSQWLVHMIKGYHDIGGG